LIEIINGRKISPWTGRHVAPQDADVPMMDNADGRMLETGLNRGNSCACLPKLWHGSASSAAGRSFSLAAGAGVRSATPTLGREGQGTTHKWPK
jgi:hypothetical protein